jgi:chemotaxis protein methyltransferase CheR
MNDTASAEQAAPTVETPISRQEQKTLESIRQWIFEYTGLNYPARKNGILYSRLQSLCWRLGIPNIKEIERLLNEDGSDWLASEVARAATTNYTFFFRENETFDFLRDYILPELSTCADWRIWSAAASSGEEAISTAILIMEALGQQQAVHKAAILGTDINYLMIQQAERGLFPEQKLEAIPKVLIRKYFEPAGSKMWRVSPLIRQMCTFRRINLMSKPWPFKLPFHVIFCRNIFYYFDKTEQFDLVERLYDATTPGGWLLTSVTETFHSMPIRWKHVTTGVWRKSV